MQKYEQEEKRFLKQEVLLGIDTIEVVIDTQTILNKNNITFYSSNGNEVGKLVHRQGKKKGYNLILNLPRCVRQNNIQPFSVLDADKIYEITTIVVKQLKKHFGEQLPDLTVKSAEVGATMEIANKKNVQPILNMITGMLLQDKENIVYIACRGKKVGQRYNKVQTLASGINVESIKLPQNSSGRFASKYYDKGLEKDIADEHGIIRVEHIYNKRGLNYAHTGNSLQEFLTVDSIHNLIMCFKRDFKLYFCDRYWSNTGSLPYYRQCIQILKNDLKTKKPLTVALMNRNIVEQDFEFFIRAVKSHYNNSASARQAIYRVRKSGEIEIHEGVATQFVMFCRQVVA